MTCVPAWVTTVTGGAPWRPSRSTSQPARARTAWRAAASAVKLAIVAPVTNPTLVPAGRPSSSTSQPAATSSATAAAGEMTYRPAFWSHALVSQSAAERRRQAAADDEPEVARPGARDESRVGGGGEPLDDLERVGRAVGERPAHRRPQRREVDRTADGAGRERCQVVGRDAGRPRTGVGRRRSSVDPPRIRRLGCATVRPTDATVSGGPR